MISVNKGFIDKLSITFYASYSAHSRINNSHKLVDVEKLLTGDVKTIVKETGRINSYKYMAWSNITEEGVVAVKYGRFAKEGGINYRYLNVEYNPRKTYLPQVLLNFIKTFGFNVIEINSLDYAVDVHNATVNDFLFVAPSQSATMSFGTLGSTSTKYLHPKSNNGRVKVYDKYTERQTASRKYKSIDCEKYKDIVRCEFTFHNMGYVLDYPYTDVEVHKASETCKFLSQVMLRCHNKDITIDIKKSDKFVIDTFLAEGLNDRVQEYIKTKGINQRKPLNDYIKQSHYMFLFPNNLSTAIRIAETIREDLYVILPEFCLPQV